MTLTRAVVGLLTASVWAGQGGNGKGEKFSAGENVPQRDPLEVVNAWPKCLKGDEDGVLPEHVEAVVAEVSVKGKSYGKGKGKGPQGPPPAPADKGKGKGGRRPSWPELQAELAAEAQADVEVSLREECAEGSCKFPARAVAFSAKLYQQERERDCADGIGCPVGCVAGLSGEPFPGMIPPPFPEDRFFHPESGLMTFVAKDLKDEVMANDELFRDRKEHAQRSLRKAWKHSQRARDLLSYIVCKREVLFGIGKKLEIWLKSARTATDEQAYKAYEAAFAQFDHFVELGFNFGDHKISPIPVCHDWDESFSSEKLTCSVGKLSGAVLFMHELGHHAQWLTFGGRNGLPTTTFRLKNFNDSTGLGANQSGYFAQQFEDGGLVYYKQVNFLDLLSSRDRTKGLQYPFLGVGTHEPLVETLNLEMNEHPISFELNQSKTLPQPQTHVRRMYRQTFPDFALLMANRPEEVRQGLQLTGLQLTELQDVTVLQLETEGVAEGSLLKKIGVRFSCRTAGGQTRCGNGLRQCHSAGPRPAARLVPKFPRR